MNTRVELDETLWNEELSPQEPEETDNTNKSPYNKRITIFNQSKSNWNKTEQNYKRLQDQSSWKSSKQGIKSNERYNERRQFDDKERSEWGSRFSNNQRRSFDKSNLDRKSNNDEKSNAGNSFYNNDKVRLNLNSRTSKNDRQQYNNPGKFNYGNRTFSERKLYDSNDKATYGNRFNNSEWQEYNSGEASSRSTRQSGWKEQGNNEKPNFTNANNEKSYWRNRGGYNEKNNFYNKEETVMKVAPCHIGRIIGRRGNQIQSIQESTQTKIDISAHEGEDHDVRITGPESGRNKAKELIEELIAHDYHRRPEYSQGRRNDTRYDKQGNFKEESSNTDWQENTELVHGNQYKQHTRNEASSDKQENFKKESPTAERQENITSIQKERPRKWENTGRSEHSSQYKQGRRYDKQENFKQELPSVSWEEEILPTQEEKPRQWERKSEHNSQYMQETRNETRQAPNKDNEVKQESQFINWQQLIAASEEERLKRWEKYPPVKKNFYKEDPEIASMCPTKVAEFRKEKNNIVIQTLDETDTPSIPNPVTNFIQAFRDFPEIIDEIQKQGFVEPSPIQCQSWPILLQGYDMIGIAQTGTGKTLAFLLPALIHIDEQTVPRDQRPGPSCLVLAPTRELAQQIERECKKYYYKGIKCVCLYGGGSRKEQINKVEKGVEIVIATPGRLNDLVMNNIIDVTCVTYLVLDEADRMLDMGFEPQIKKVLLDIRPDRQTVMTSATWPEGVRRMSSQYMKSPILVFIGSLDIRTVHSVSQQVYIVENDEKKQILYEFIENMKPEDKVIVFVDKKIVADDLASDLLLNRIECQSIHGDREQCDREQAIEDIRSGLARILVATDVASRGLDIKDITHIFNYDFPRNIEEYVHRVGRTGRAGQTGSSITLMTRSDWSKAKHLIEILEEAGQEISQDLLDMANRYDTWKAKKDAEDNCARRGGRSGNFNRYRQSNRF